MAGIYGKSNIIAHVTAMALPYWKLYYDKQSKESGNCIGSANFSIENLGMVDSTNDLQRLLDRLTPGAYLLTAYEKPDGRKGGVNTPIEIEANPLLQGGNAAVSGVAGPQEAYVEGIGMVGVHNIGEAIDAKIAAMFKKKEEEERWKKLEEENARLKKELQESEGGINRGLMAVGSVLYGTMSKTEAGKEFIGLVKDVLVQSKGVRATSAANADQGSQEQPADTSQEERVIAAIGSLSENNAGVADDLELLAKLKKHDPSMYAEGVDFIKSMVPEN
jgi:hypothetical protein